MEVFNGALVVGYGPRPLVSRVKNSPVGTVILQDEEALARQCLCCESRGKWTIDQEFIRVPPVCLYDQRALSANDVVQRPIQPSFSLVTQRVLPSHALDFCEGQIAKLWVQIYQ